MSDNHDPAISELLDHLYVEPGAEFWQTIDRELAAESRRSSDRTAIGLRVVDPAGVDPAGEFDLPTPVPLRPEDPHRRWWQSPRLVAAAAVMVVVGLVGVSVLLPKDDPDTTVAADDTLDDSPSTSVADPTTTAPITTTPTTSPAAPNAIEARIAVQSGSLGGFDGLAFTTVEGTFAIATDHAADVAGQPLVTNVVSDGAGGFVYGLIDYDDSRSDRSTRLLHVAAGATNPNVVVTEPQSGIGFVAGVLTDDRGTVVVYTTLLETVTRAVPLTGGDPVTISADEAVSAASDTVVVVGDDECRSFSLIGPDGNPSAELVSPRPADLCAEDPTPVYEVGLSPDGTMLAWVAEDSGCLEVADLTTGRSVASIDLEGTSNHVVRFDGDGVVLLRSAEELTEVYVRLDGTVVPLPDARTALSTAGFDSYVIDPNLVLALG